MAKLTATEWIWHEGTFVKWDDAQIHLLAHSMQFGSAVFEGVRAYQTSKGPAIFRLREHLKRLFDSCKIYRMPMHWTADQIFEATRETVRRNDPGSCYIRPMVLRGYGAAGMVPFDSPVETYIPCWPWTDYLGAKALEEGIDARISSWHRVAPNTTPAIAKIAGNYLNGQLIKMEALADGYHEAIALGVDGMISEGSGQNAFVVANGTLYTPPIDGTLLPGITRSSVIQIAADLNIPVKVEPIAREVLHTCDEVFLCGTATEVAPVRSVDRIPVGDGTVGPITRAIQTRYLDYINGRVEDVHGWLTHC
jgi:branched-chain amino acid aminotransferase